MPRAVGQRGRASREATLRTAESSAPRSAASSELGPNEDRAAVEHLSQRLWRAEARLAEARTAIAASEQRLDEVYGSTSWRVTAPLRRFSMRPAAAARVLRRGAKVAWWTVTLQLPRRLREREAAIADAERALRERPPATYAEWAAEYDTLDASDLEGMTGLYDTLDRAPLVSVLMPVCDPPENVLRQAIESVRTQAYANWELCIADDASSRAHVGRVLQQYERMDERVRVVRRSRYGGSSAASNSALAMARGELVAILHQDDLLRPHSLLLSVLPFRADSRVGLVYSDSDRIDERGRRLSPSFKPDWNPGLLLSRNYVCELCVIRADLVRAVGGFRDEFDGSEEWDLAFRVTELLPSEGVAHVPHVLYHRRASAAPMAPEGAATRPDAVDAGRRATEDHLERTGRHGYVLPVGDHQTVRFFVGSPRPRVSVVVPSTGRRDLLEPCITGLLSRTDYDELEVVVAVDEQAHQDPRSGGFLTELASRPRVRVLTYPSRPFNYALTINEAVARTETSLVLLLNDDTEVVYDDWLEAMAGYAGENRVGAVGGLLVYPDGTIHSAGMLVGARSIAEHRYHRLPALVPEYANRVRLSQDVSVVTATCMLVTRDAFDGVGGLDVSFPVAYNDIDFCLKLRRAGWRIVYAPDAILVHRGSASFETHQRGREPEHMRDAARMQQRWGVALHDDPMHNPNLALDASDLSRPAAPPRVVYPWRRRRLESRRDAA